MFVNSPALTLYFLIASILLFAFLFILNSTGLTPIPLWVFQVYGITLALIFFWWPIDLLIHWDKRTEAEEGKDRLIACLSIGIIVFVVPHYILYTPFYATLAAAVVTGAVLPGLYEFIIALKNRQITISPGLVLKEGLTSNKAQKFQAKFPKCRQYVIDYTGGGSRYAKLVLHERIPYERFKGAHIDYVFSIPVARKTGILVEGLEKLECYLFINDEGKAGVAFLPSANFGRALDYGFDDEEIDGAVEEAKRHEQGWGAIDFDPITIQHYTGQYVRMR